MRKTFEQTCIAALTFCVKTKDKKLARQVRSALHEAGGTWTNKTQDLLKELLEDRQPLPPLPGGATSIEPALAEIASAFTNVRTPAEIASLKTRMTSALTIASASEETMRRVSEVMASFERLSGGVGLHEARDLLQRIADLAAELDEAHGRQGDNSLTVVLKAVDRARTFAADQIEGAPAPWSRCRLAGAG